MKKSDIKLGKRYAVKFDGAPECAAVIRPEKDRWVVVFDPTPDLPEDPVSARTETVPSRAILAPWTDYCIDSAHQDALAMDSARTTRIEYEAEWEQRRRERTPLCEALQGITIPGAAVSSANFDLPDLDLGEYVAEKFIEQRTSGVSVSFDVFAAVAREILDLRAALLDSSGGWIPDERADSGIREMTTATSTPLATIERLEAAARESDA